MVQPSSTFANVDIEKSENRKNEAPASSRRLMTKIVAESLQNIIFLYSYTVPNSYHMFKNDKSHRGLLEVLI